MDKSKEIEFNSELFSVKEIGEGIYALLEKNIGEAGSNAGIIKLGDECIVFDTFVNIDATNDLKKLCDKLFGKQPSYIINSHSHADHIIGNYLFKNAKVISSKQTRETIIEFKEAFHRDVHKIPALLEEAKQDYEKEVDETKKMNLKNRINFYSSYIKPNITIKVPDITIEKEMILHSEDRNMHLSQYPISHSKGDVIAILPEDKVCFTGDLLFIEQHPWLGSGDPRETIKILKTLLESDIEYFVPGHGRVANREDVLLQIQYIEEMIELVKSKKALKDPTFSVKELSSVFHDWYPLCFQWNINFLLEQKY